MCSARIHFQFSIGHNIDSQQSGRLDGDDLVIVSMQNEHGDVHFLQVLCVVLLPRLDAVIDSLEAAHHALLEPGVDQSLALDGTLAVEAEERAGGDVDEELSAVLEHGAAEAVEDRYRQALGVALGLQHLWRNGADENGL